MAGWVVVLVVLVVVVVVVVGGYGEEGTGSFGAPRGTCARPEGARGPSSSDH